MTSNSLLVSLCNGSNVTITTRYFPTSPSYWCAFIYLAAYLKQHTRDGSEASWASPGLINLVSGGKCITQAGVNQMQKTELASHTWTTTAMRDFVESQADRNRTGERVINYDLRTLAIS